jgi:hypothetical protein
MRSGTNASARTLGLCLDCQRWQQHVALFRHAPGEGGAHDACMETGILAKGSGIAQKVFNIVESNLPASDHSSRLLPHRLGGSANVENRV